ncbi:rhodanese-like domain-containing protein [Apibacter muscae]|uniref:rhodanese-like domain-containing protein n=1 Tax=Apibacter muscae TaxID=2509004 RepID=UPI0011AC1C7A|nr:rhodanese-like domain-containing protein [Apibacter muscae]TWP24707.1 rhodanese-like domain-containing protein [Apibacter muscae]
MEIDKVIKEPTVTFLDVREKEELINEGEVKGAILIPMREVPERLDEIKLFSKPLVVFCRSGNRSENVVKFLKDQGLTEVYNGGGFNEVNELLENH